MNSFGLTDDTCLGCSILDCLAFVHSFCLILANMVYNAALMHHIISKKCRLLSCHYKASSLNPKVDCEHNDDKQRINSRHQYFMVKVLTVFYLQQCVELYHINNFGCQTKLSILQMGQYQLFRKRDKNAN